MSTGHKKNNKWVLRFLISYSFIIIIILSMGLYMYSIGIKTAKEKLIEDNYQALETSVKSMDMSFQIISTLSSQVVNKQSIQKFIKQTKVDSNYFIEALDVMSYFTSLLPTVNITFINNCYLYLHKTDYIVSSNLLENSNLYYRFARWYQSDLYNDWIDKITSIEYAAKLIPMDSYTISGNSDILMYTLPSSLYNYYLTDLSSICFEISETELAKLFSNLNLFDTGFIYILDQEKNPMLPIKTSKTIEFSTEEFLSKVSESEEDSFFIDLNSYDMVVTSYVSNSNQWIYYLVQPESMAFEELESYQRNYSLIIVTAILLSILFIVILSIKQLQPMLNIASRLKDSLNNPDQVDDKRKGYIHSIDNYVNLLIHQHNTLQQTLEHQRPIVYSSLLAKLMKGLVVTQEEFKHIQDYFKLEVANKIFIVSAIQILIDEIDYNNSTIAVEENSTYKQVIKSKLYDYFDYSILVYEADHRSFYVLYLLPNEMDLDHHMSHIKQSFYNLYHDLLNNYSIEIVGGLSNSYEDILSTWQGCQQAAEAITYVHASNTIQIYKEIKREKSMYYYPYELEQQLINFITTNNKKQVSLIFHQLQVINFEENQLPIDMMKYFLGDIRNTLLKVRFSLPGDTNEELIGDITRKMQGQKSLKLLEDIALLLCQLYEPKTNINTLIRNIQQYICENYTDSSLSLANISEKFSISESYFSSLFKSEIKINFSEYLENLRIEQSLKLLKTTDINISDIFQEVGYNNAYSFRRAFKKLMGVTPKAVRDGANLCGQGEESAE